MGQAEERVEEAVHAAGRLGQQFGQAWHPRALAIGTSEVDDLCAREYAECLLAVDVTAQQQRRDARSRRHAGGAVAVTVRFVQGLEIGEQPAKFGDAAERLGPLLAELLAQPTRGMDRFFDALLGLPSRADRAS